MNDSALVRPLLRKISVESRNRGLEAKRTPSESVRKATIRFPFYYSDFLKVIFLKEGLFLTALKPRGLTLSLPPEKGWKETAKGGIMFPPFETPYKGRRGGSPKSAREVCRLKMSGSARSNRRHTSVVSLTHFFILPPLRKSSKSFPENHNYSQKMTSPHSVTAMKRCHFYRL